MARSRELADGRVSCAPVADLSLASFGEEEDALAEQRAFLEEYLAGMRPEVLARRPGLRDAAVEVLVEEEPAPSPARRSCWSSRPELEPRDGTTR